ncbi:MAG: filamentous hemagglutinin N-terminal domain-containing protein, partial [Pseudomonadales bacterium]|nr:filamentous hemagglutinin N-terminal domain-containing protein [Pseudomonadales bacterium]
MQVSYLKILMTVSVVIIPTLLFPAYVYSDIVPDGSSNTSVFVNAAGVEFVDIALPNSSGVSYNAYDRFDVSSKGAVLRNLSSITNARTIINEVTSRDISQIYGDLRVHGTTAHVIIANPNGIQVDGGRFLNMGALALTTGRIGYETVIDGGGGGTRENIVISTDGGEIVVGPGGLSGTMLTLDLIAKAIKIQGAIELQESALSDTKQQLQKIDIYAGSSRTVIDSSVPIADVLEQQWNTVKATGSIQDQLVVDITRGGSLRAGSIKIVVTDEGAGFRHAGEIFADGNNFLLQADGSIVNKLYAQIEGGQITTTATAQEDGKVTGGHLTIDVHNLTITSDAKQQAQLVSSDGSILIKSVGNVSNTGGLLQASGANPDDEESLGAITMNIGGNFFNGSDNAEQLGVLFAVNDLL